MMQEKTKSVNTQNEINRYDIVVVGCSMGGLHALQVLASGLPESFPVPVLVVQHRGYDAKRRLCSLIQGSAHLTVTVAQDKADIHRGHIYIAPPDYHQLIEDGYCSLSIDEPVCNARPSIDVLFESAAEIYGSRTIGVVLTGANEDGAHGAAMIENSGGLVVAQDPRSAENRIMPEAAIRASETDHVMFLNEIAPFLCRCTEENQRDGVGK